MNYGVTITGGAVPWQIFAQDAEGYAPIQLRGEYHLIHLSQELPLEFSTVAPARATVKARIAREDTGESVIPWTECRIPEQGRWEIEFPRVPAGGLYRIETTMDYEGWDGLSCTRGDMVHHIVNGRHTHLYAGITKTINDRKHLSCLGVPHHLDAQIRIHRMHRNIDRADVQINNALHFPFADGG